MMGRDDQKIEETPDRTPKAAKAGWRAFALGMIGMFALIILWIVMADAADDPHGDAALIERPQSAEERTLERREARADRPISDHR